MFERNCNRSAWFGCALAIAVVATPAVMAQQSIDVEISNISGDIDAPRRHTRIKQSEDLDQDEAARVYQLVKGALARGYGSADTPLIDRYQQLKKFNTMPYRSASHGNHYLNNYANETAEIYGRYEKAGVFPAGSILFKDSFTVAANQEIVLGPMFIMEKMEPGFNPVSADWKYTQVQPTGQILGETNGENSDKVTYCISCHLAREDMDHLFFVPEEVRE